MKYRDILIAILIIVVIFVCWLFINERQKNELKDKAIRRLTNENDEIKKAYLDLLQQYLLLKEDTPKEIIAEIEKLKLQTVNLSRDVHIELGSVIDCVRRDDGANAVRELGNIIENVLKQKALADQNFKKRPTLSNLLDYAKLCNWIKPNDYAYAELIRDIRNQKSHELNFRIENHKVGLAIYAGINIIYTLDQKIV